MSITEDLAERLMEELNCETVFTIPVFGGIPIAESVVVSWIIMAVLTILSICLVRNLKVENPGKKQLALEVAIGGIYKFFDDLVGEEGRRYIPYLISFESDLPHRRHIHPGFHRQSLPADLPK